MLNQRQPYVTPAIGTRVHITTRTFPKQQFWSEIAQIGAHFEIITNGAAFLRPGLLVDVALPIVVPVPPQFELRPGEIVDLQIKHLRPIGTAAAAGAQAGLRRRTASIH